LRSVTVPLTVTEDEPLAPLVKLRPFVEASARVPCDAESVSESAFDAVVFDTAALAPEAFDPAAASVIEIALLFALENVNEPFSLREPPPGAEIAGAEIAGAFNAATVIDTLVAADRLSVGSETDTAKESAPE
jgi:hypothetical protein